LLAELWAWLAEAVFYALAFRRLTLTRALAVSALANGASVLVGLALFRRESAGDAAGGHAQEGGVRRAGPVPRVAPLLVAAPAHAYRPFDQTDAAVSELHEFELELGPVGYTHDAAGGAYTPGFILNYGIVPRVELVFDAHHALLYGGAEAAARRREL